MEKLKWKCVNNLKKSIFNKLYMSGSAALSAAKNRRTATAPPPPPGGNNKQPQKNVNSAPEQIEVPKNPLQILYMHELRLNKLETEPSDIVKSVPSNEGLIISLSDKITLLEKQCSALKDELSKVISFAMETNRSFLLYKNDKEQQQAQSQAQIQAQLLAQAQIQAQLLEQAQAQAQIQAQFQAQTQAQAQAQAQAQEQLATL